MATPKQRVSFSTTGTVTPRRQLPSHRNIWLRAAPGRVGGARCARVKRASAFAELHSPGASHTVRGYQVSFSGILKLLKHQKPRTVCQRNPRRGFWPAHGTHAVGSVELPEPTPWVPHTAPTPWVLASCRNPRRGFRRAAGTHAVGSGQLPEPTPWVLATSQNPRRGFWTPARTHAVGSGHPPEPTPWVLDTHRNPRRGFRPRRGFWPPPRTHAVGSGHLPEPTPWVLDTHQNPRRGAAWVLSSPTLFLEFHFQGLCLQTVLGFWCFKSFTRRKD